METGPLAGRARMGGPRPREPQVDGLRFFAFLAAFFNHATPATCPWGWAGVQFFFALSGFLITRILIRGESGDPGADLRRYYLRRTPRIFPLYYAVVGLVATSDNLRDLGWYLTSSYNVRAYLDRHLDDVLGHFWTLYVEEQFYLLYPLAVLFTPGRLRLPLLAALIAGAKAFQIYAHDHLALPAARLLLPYCGEDLLWGCVAGLVDLRAGPRRRGAEVLVVVGVPTLVLAWNLHERRLALPPVAQEIASPSAFGIGSALIVLGAWRSEARWLLGPLSVAPLAYLGRISYGLYALHLPVLHAGWYAAIPYGFLIPRPCGELALTIGLAAASWRFFEGPINRLKDRLDPRRPTEAVSWTESRGSSNP